MRKPQILPQMSTTTPLANGEEGYPDATICVCSELELTVARRADELARVHGYDRARKYWMEAEAELLFREFELTWRD